MSKRRTHSPEFKARVAMEAISGRKTLQEIAADHAVHPIQVSPWKKQAVESTPYWPRGTPHSWLTRHRCRPELTHDLWRNHQVSSICLAVRVSHWEASRSLSDSMENVLRRKPLGS